MAKPINENLTDAQRKVLFENATEPPFTGSFLQNKEAGMYICANCSTELFDSSTKFESGSGWPSFYDVQKSGAVTLIDDSTAGMQRIEVRCGTCDSHLGHVFDDAYGQPTGKRYCINSLALGFKNNKK